ncbi:MAG TPA: DUF4382 domain-containing protein, partial [Candidatus Nanoarchaeia archaeon]|nr:DUF4382 domain-containing protein [Candidatus Nanoarchaeia archaeon]
NEIKINANLAVKENTTSTASFDFIADESLHITGNGKYIMAPVVKLETREDADAEVKSNNEVEIKGGKTKTNVKVGMDEKGNVGIGLKIPVDVNINLDVSGGISLGTSDETEMELGKGRVVFAVKDKAADMGSVTKIKVTIENVKVQSAAGTWTTVSSSPKTYDLLELNSKNEAMLLADVQLDKGVYNQVRLNISKVVVTDSEGDHEAKLPSGDLKIIGKLYVNENSTSTTTVDFEANQSLHKTGNDEYLLAPVVKFETRDNAEVSIKNNVVDIEKGTVRTNIEIGMDSKGNVGIGLKINANADISI